MFWRIVRAMLPYKTARGSKALSRLKIHEGIPPPWNRKKRVVCPRAMRVFRLQPRRKFCTLGDLAASVGWKHQAIIREFEEKRKERTHRWWKKREQLKKLLALARRQVDAIIPPINLGDGAKIGAL
eukprot:TRINITY_DN2764_c0_g1_i2.p2 TRINITY_DN2764_c0_g1~~TRINITY_DN2764_c0_g1_i2.p2  ORF type:complete len:144 (+),score=25.68 TRINITY_DN2764_c0_g1_i2:55-432(+)